MTGCGRRSGKRGERIPLNRRESSPAGLISITSRAYTKKNTIPLQEHWAAEFGVFLQPLGSYKLKSDHSPGKFNRGLEGVGALALWGMDELAAGKPGLPKHSSQTIRPSYTSGMTQKRGHQENAWGHLCTRNLGSKVGCDAGDRKIFTIHWEMRGGRAGAYEEEGVGFLPIFCLFSTSTKASLDLDLTLNQKHSLDLIWGSGKSGEMATLHQITKFPMLNAISLPISSPTLVLNLYLPT